jgi:MFS transporter, DHA1 family, multidrug resistance protein
MLLRAMIGGGISVALFAVARTPVDLLALRILQGAASGTVAASTTLVATGTPRVSVGRAMGILSSAVALGSAVGPLAGGLAANYIPLRYVFLGGGVLLLIAVVPVAFGVREAPLVRRVTSEQRTGMMGVLRMAGPGVVLAVFVLLASQSLLQMAWSGGQPLISLRLLQLSPSSAASATGLAFAASGVAAAISGISYSRLAQGWGYRWLASFSSVAAAVALLAMGLAPSIALVVVASFLAGLCVGAALPAITAMLGLETPADVQGRVFGLSASATALGFGLGPLLAGTIAGVLSIEVGFFVMAGAALLLALLVSAAGREPTR